MKPKTWRKIVVDHIEYKWMYGQTAIVIRDVDNAVVAKPSVEDVSGWRGDDIERGQWKGYFHLTPKHVAEWIKKNL